VSFFDPEDTLGTIRTIVLTILVLGLIGAAVELLLIGHHEDVAQLLPLLLIALGLAAIFWNLLWRTTLSLLVMRFIMAAFIASGVLGIALHYRGSAEFQREIDPTIGGFALIAKAMRAKAPPALAPGLMVQLGLLGLAYTYRQRME
jgi:hypothetical protein